MRAIRLGLAAAAILAALVTSPRASGAQTPTFPSQVELVTVDAIVLGEKGRPVRGLTREDFTLSEDGKLQEIVSFEAFDGAEVAEEASPARRRWPRTPAPPRTGPEPSSCWWTTSGSTRGACRGCSRPSRECCRAPSARETR